MDENVCIAFAGDYNCSKKVTAGTVDDIFERFSTMAHEVGYLRASKSATH